MDDLTATETIININTELDQLILAVAKQDQISLQKIYYLCRRSIFAVAYAITNDYHLSEDILQDTILRIWEKASSYRQGSSSKAWIHSIAHNRSIDIIRQQNHSISMENFKDYHLPEQLISRTEPDDRIQLVSGLNYLNKEQAIIFVLKTIVNLSHLETSKILNIPYRVVRYRHHQAILKLKEFLSIQEG